MGTDTNNDTNGNGTNDTNGNGTNGNGTNGNDTNNDTNGNDTNGNDTNDTNNDTNGNGTNGNDTNGNDANGQCGLPLRATRRDACGPVLARRERLRVSGQVANVRRPRTAEFHRDRPTSWALGKGDPASQVRVCGV